MDVLAALPAPELAKIIGRLGIKVDPAKRLEPAAQVARVLVTHPDVRDPARLPTATLELLHRIAEARGSLVVASVPPAADPLVARGSIYLRGHKANVELVLPIAFLLRLRPWEGEDPRGIRALLAQASTETATAIASHYLGRPATPPIGLSLEQAWETLGDPTALEAEVKKLSTTERRVLEGVEREGGEVDTEELLELEREPLRLRTATGATPSRRGVGFSLERRGLLVPVHPNRHIVPTEVSRIVGAASQREREERRLQVKTFVIEGDHAPRRARFATDPGPVVLAAALAFREPGTDVRPTIGTPRSLVQKLATRFGRDPSHMALLIALSRATGLWDPSAMNAGGPPGICQLSELARLLFLAWRRGGAWDEARADPEVLRLPADNRDPSPVGVLRDMVTEALRDLGEERWVPWRSLEGYLASDQRIPGLARLFRRWAERAGVEEVDPIRVARRIVLESLPCLGLLDLGNEEGGDTGVALRLTARGRALLADKHPTSDSARSTFVDANLLRVGSTTTVATLLGVGAFVEVARAQEVLELVVAPQTLAKALAAGFEADLLRQRMEAIAPLPDALARTLVQASIVVGRATFVAATGFLWVEDGNVRELLRTRRATADLFVDPSPPAGLLLSPSVDLERLARRARTVGVEILYEGQVVRARTMPPPGTGPQPRIPAPARIPREK